MAETIRYDKYAIDYAAGSAAAPATAASYPVYDLTWMTRKKNDIPGRPAVGSYQPGRSYVGDQFSEVSFRQELYGQRASAEHPHCGRLLEACGFGVSGTTAFTYAVGDPHIDGDTPDGVTEPMSIAVNVDGLEHAAANCVGTVRLDIAAGQIPMLSYSFLGHDTVGAASAVSETAQTAYATEVFPSPAQAGSFTIGGTSVVCRSLSYDLANALTPRLDINGTLGRSQTIIPGRAPTGTCIVEVGAIGTFNPETLAFAASKTSQAFSYTHNDGGTVFNEILITFTAYIKNITDITSDARVAVWVIEFEQDYSTGPLTLAWSDN